MLILITLTVVHYVCKYSQVTFRHIISNLILIYILVNEFDLQVYDIDFSITLQTFM